MKANLLMSSQHFDRGGSESQTQSCSSPAPQVWSDYGRVQPRRRHQHGEEHGQHAQKPDQL